MAAATDLKALHDVMYGKVRGHPVAISLFHDEVPAVYQAKKVDPCAIVRLAMDDGEIVHVDREHHDCITGAYTAGFDEGTPDTRTGQYLAKHIPAITDEGAAAAKSGEYVLPQGLVRAIGAAPLDRVPEGVEVNWIVAVCTPYWANFIGGARSVVDGTPPHGAAGTSFCSELFATPWYSDNVVLAPGDIGGRMNNRLKPEEMFVIVPMQWTGSLISILGTTPDTRAIYEATRPPDSPYWLKRKRAAEKKKAAGERAEIFTMLWDEEAQELLARMPGNARDTAIETMEEFAHLNHYDSITRTVIDEQMRSIGMDPAILDQGN